MFLDPNDQFDEYLFEADLELVHGVKIWIQRIRILIGNSALA